MKINLLFYKNLDYHEQGKDLIKENAKNGKNKAKGVKLDATSAAWLEQEVQMNTMMHQLSQLATKPFQL